MNQRIDTRRLIIFLSIAFTIAWAAELVIYLTGGLTESQVLVPNTPITLALVLLIVPVMWAPALANILTRLLTHEGWGDTQLRPHFKQEWRYWVAAWFLPGVLSIMGMVIFFLLFPRHYDSHLGTLREMIAAAPSSSGLAELNIWLLIGLQTLQALLLAPLLNSLATFGEEFGWRGYLQTKLLPLGERRALLLTGLIWGIWHWPIILMGHNYGLTYPGAPWLGLLGMLWFCLNLGVLLGWLTLKSRSVWPAVIGHAAINGSAGLGLLFAQGAPNPILGPSAVGVIGGLGFTAVAGWLLFGIKARG